MNLAEDLALVLELQELGNLIANTFGEVLHLKSAALMIPSRPREDFEIISTYGWSVSDAKRARFPKDSALVTLMRERGPHVLVRDRLVRTLSWQEASRLAHDFDSFRASWVIPLLINVGAVREPPHQEAPLLVGAIGFSSFSPASIFDEADFHFFREFARAAAKCAYNALRFQELKRANQELQDVQSQLLQRAKLAAIEQLATGIAHEIHNPLTIISGKAQVLLLQKDRAPASPDGGRAGACFDERVEEALKTIVKQTKRAADITKKLLMFSQGSGAPREMLSLEQVLEDTVALVSYQASLEGIELTRKAAGPIPLFLGNVHELREVMLNLVLNAVQSVRPRGRVHCEIHYRSKDQIVELLVSDTGRGIPPESIDKLFNPFFTTRREAAGLGLFVTRQIVHRYGGSIRVESRPGEGSLFTVQLPYREPDPSGSKEAAQPLFSGGE